jgi:mono/diheme cytochrome c family protein
MALAWLVAGFLSPVVFAQQPRTVRDGVYTSAQAARGQALYKQRCASCHGQTLGGANAPPLTGNDFLVGWSQRPVSELFDKVHILMPADKPGTLTRQEAVDVTAYVLEVGGFPPGQVALADDDAALRQITLPDTPAAPRQSGPAAAQVAAFPPFGTLAQMMRGILFPSSNIIFDVQTRDPGQARAPSGTSNDSSLTDRFADAYQGWALVDYAATAIVDATPMMLTPGRRCENGQLVPVDRPDWIKFSLDMAEAGRAAYRASQSRSQEAVAEATNQLAESCQNCHQAYRNRRNVLRCVVAP